MTFLFFPIHLVLPVTLPTVVDDDSRGRTLTRMTTRSRSFFTVGGCPVVVQDGWEAVDGESCRWRRRGVWGAVNTCERRISRDDTPSLYQGDFWVINETDICLTDWRELSGKDLQSCFTHLVRTTSCGPPAGVGPSCFSFLCHGAKKHR